jgi:periplasmic protein TonB
MEEVMFDSLALENQKRKWATMISFAIETTFVAMLVAAPLAFTDKLQSLHFGDRLVAPMAMTAEPASPPEHQAVNNASRSEVTPEGRVVAPSSIPPTVAQLVDRMQIGQAGPSDSIPGAVPMSDQLNPLMRHIIADLKPRGVSTSAAASHGPVIISHLNPGMLINRVQPIYPHAAILTKTEGTVTLTAIIDASGRITHLQVVSGPPLLINAALDAVRQWRYRPYILNGSPVEVETQVSVVFNLNSH